MGVFSSFLMASVFQAFVSAGRKGKLESQSGERLVQLNNPCTIIAVACASIPYLFGIILHGTSTLVSSGKSFARGGAVLALATGGALNFMLAFNALRAVVYVWLASASSSLDGPAVKYGADAGGPAGAGAAPVHASLRWLLWRFGTSVVVLMTGTFASMIVAKCIIFSPTFFSVGGVIAYNCLSSVGPLATGLAKIMAFRAPRPSRLGGAVVDPAGVDGSVAATTNTAPVMLRLFSRGGASAVTPTSDPPC